MKPENKIIRFTIVLMYLLMSLGAWAQGPHGGGPPPGGGPHMNSQAGHGEQHAPPPGAAGVGTQSTMRGGLQLGPPGRWWDDKSFARDIGLSSDQKKNMDGIFKENKGTLVSLYNALGKEESGLERLTKGTHLDEERIDLQIDKVTQARAALEKANAHMLLQIRNQMSDEQVGRLDEHRLAPQ